MNRRWHPTPSLETRQEFAESRAFDKFMKVARNIAEWNHLSLPVLAEVMIRAAETLRHSGPAEVQEDGDSPP